MSAAPNSEKTAWTPGPWRAERSRDFSGDVGIACPDGVLAECFAAIRVHSERSDEVNANARLIAAAPDLFNAAVLALELIECLQDEEGHSPSTAIPARALRAAIAAARGEQQ